jgi:4-hydroxy-L-threonine phosphate dehydrogenase PdxA
MTPANLAGRARDGVGGPHGIGPEIAVIATWARAHEPALHPRIVLFGHTRVIRRHARRCAPEALVRDTLAVIRRRSRRVFP